MSILMASLPEDVQRILQDQAAEMGQDPEVYAEMVRQGFDQYIAKNPGLTVAALKKGWDMDLAFLDFVRQEADAILLNAKLAAASRPDATPQERAAAFRAWAHFPRRKVPLLSDEDISRESIYGDVA